MHTFLASVKKRRASVPPSRPTPLCFIPPKGVRRSRSIQQFTHTMPLLSARDTRWARFTSDAAEPALVLEQTGAAVTLCSLTTIVGYGTLLFSQNQALQSFGKLACLGEATCLISALWLLPAFARFFRTQPGPHPLA